MIIGLVSVIPFESAAPATQPASVTAFSERVSEIVCANAGAATIRVIPHSTTIFIGPPLFTHLDAKERPPTAAFGQLIPPPADGGMATHVPVITMLSAMMPGDVPP